MELKWKTCLKAALTALALFFVFRYWTAFADIIGLAVGAAFPLCGISQQAWMVDAPFWLCLN